MFCFFALVFLFLGVLPFTSYAQSSCTQLSPSGGIRPSIASGYQMQVVATGLSKPRGIKLDGASNLLVVEQDRGVVSSHRISEDNGCVSLEDATDLTRNLGVSQTPMPNASCSPSTSSTMASKCPQTEAFCMLQHHPMRMLGTMTPLPEAYRTSVPSSPT